MKLSKPTLYWLAALGAIVLVAIGLTIYWNRPIAYSNSYGGVVDGKGGGYATSEMAVKDMAYAPEAATTSYYASDSSYIDTSGATQLIIKSADLTITTSNIESIADSITTIATQYGGSVTNRSISNYPDSVKSGWISIDVASTNFDAAMSSIKLLANTVQSENIYANDVTKTVVDLQARLSNAQAEEAQYLLIMSRATTVEDMISIQSALSSVRERIEIMQSEMDYYNNSVTKSTISIYMTEETTIGFEKNSFRPLQTIIEAAQTVIELFQSFVIALIYVIAVGGAILIPAGAIFIIVRAIWRKYRR